jgi:hypothetical protein
MSTDFYEERKFKIAGAYLLAKAVREYHESDNRESLIHKVFLFGLSLIKSGRDGCEHRSNTLKRRLMLMRMS